MPLPSISRLCGGWRSAAPDKYADSGKKWFSMLYSAALRQGDLDWLNSSTRPYVAMFGHQNAIYDKAFSDYFGLSPRTRARLSESDGYLRESSARTQPLEGACHIRQAL